jgi:DNA-binding FadR family transcriptional regulator
MNAIPAGRRPSRSLAQMLVEELTRLIEDGAIAVGEKLPPEKLITEEHGVSRTVVREAISQLQCLGLVETRHGIGTFVVGQIAAQPQPQTDRTLGDVLAVIELRMAVEVDAAGLAASRRNEAHLARMAAALATLDKANVSRAEAVEADYDFHQQIALATDNRYFADINEHLGTELIPRTRLNSAALGNTEPGEYNARLRHEHLAIYQTIANSDPAGAKAAMHTHLSNIRERLRQAYLQRES